MMKRKIAPILLFVYNRPEHTKHTLNSLLKNKLAENSELFVFCDGMKQGDIKNEKKIKLVREIVYNIEGFKSVQILERNENWGLAKSIIDGVTSIINSHNKVIVLEDDIVTSPVFLEFMNEALNYYEDYKNVWHISGWNYPISIPNESEYFFWQIMNCWGWGTWSDRWDYFEKNPQRIVDEWSKKKISQFDLDNSGIFWSQVKENLSGKLDTWAIFWYATIFEHNGLCLNPVTSLTQNIGHDGTGENCDDLEGRDYFLTGELSQKFDITFSKNIKSSKLAIRNVKDFYLLNKPSILSRILNKFREIF